MSHRDLMGRRRRKREKAGESRAGERGRRGFDEKAEHQQLQMLLRSAKVRMSECPLVWGRWG